MSTTNQLIHDEPQTKMFAGLTGVATEGGGDSAPDEPGDTPPGTDPGPDRKP